MKRVTGIGGIFFKARDAASLRAWYQRHLGIDVQPWGGATFSWADGADPPRAGQTVWSIGEVEDDATPAPNAPVFTINYRVDDLQGLIAALRQEGCEVLEPNDASAYGEFAWVIDPEGNKVELWQPPPGQ